ncbi:MAG: RES family NAD+ phosphorylase [Patescibacteria group bacterium]|nr:RES family NAD+ phosphorylase [Patescibacteria group bacterium]
MKGIDPKYFNPKSRFGKAFYVSEMPDTTLAELYHHASAGTHTIRFTLNSKAARILDLTDPAVAKAWGYSGGPITSTTQALGGRARAAGFNVVRFTSERGRGANLAILDDFDDLLAPQMVVPAPTPAVPSWHPH